MKDYEPYINIVLGIGFLFIFLTARKKLEKNLRDKIKNYYSSQNEEVIAINNLRLAQQFEYGISLMSYFKLPISLIPGFGQRLTFLRHAEIRNESTSKSIILELTTIGIRVVDLKELKEYKL